MAISDEKMLLLMAEAIRKGVARNETDFLAKISFSRTNISNVRKGIQSFTREHIQLACELTGANANWIFGLESNVYRKSGKDPIEQLKEAVIAVEAEFKSRNKK